MPENEEPPAKLVGSFFYIEKETKIKIEVKIPFGTVACAWHRREEPKMLINYLIKEIVLFDDRMEIYFNSPIKKCPDESRGFSFYSSFADMHVCLYSNTAPQVKKMRIEMYVG